MRVKRGMAAHRRHKRYLKLAKGYRGARSKLYRTAREAVENALVYSYRDRKVKNREFRKLWILRINAGARMNGISYSKLMNGLKVSGIEINRKMLAEMAIHDPAGFAQLAETAKKAVK